MTVVDDRVSLVDLLDRLLGAGVVIGGDVVISIAEVDLVQVSLRALVMSVRAAERETRPSVRAELESQRS